MQRISAGVRVNEGHTIRHPAYTPPSPPTGSLASSAKLISELAVGDGN